MSDLTNDQRLYDPAEWRFNSDTGIWYGSNDEQINYCERCGEFPFITLIIHSTGPHGEPNVEYGTFCQRDAAIFPNFPEGAWAQTGE